MNLKVTAYYYIKSILGNEFIICKYNNDCAYWFLASRYNGKDLMTKCRSNFTKLLFARNKRDFDKVIKTNKIIKLKKLSKEEAFLHLL